MARRKSSANRRQQIVENENIENEQPENNSEPSTSSSTNIRQVQGPLCLQTDDRQIICRLPSGFGSKVWLFSTLNSETKGLWHIIIKHQKDFRNEANLLKELKNIIKFENYIGQEYENRFIWKFIDSRGNPRELVTALKVCGKHFELITAWKRAPVIRDEDRHGSTDSLLSTTTSWLSKLFGSCFGCCSTTENAEEEEEYH